MEKIRVNLDDTRTTPKRKYWYFQCECGKMVSRRSDSTAAHCGLADCQFSAFKHHGKSGTRLYNIWSGMRDRCVNGCHKSSVTYKDKGIGIDDEWSLFTNFQKWALGNGYEDSLTIDRIDINKNYSPENCEWVTREENTSRQSKAYHGNQKSVVATKVSTLKSTEYKSIADAARTLIKLEIPRTTSVKNVSTIIGNVLNKDHKLQSAYGYTFKEAK